MTPDRINTAIRHLKSADRDLSQVISEVGAFRLRLESNRFRMLVRSIVSQQISTSAARSIRKRLDRLFAPHRMTAQRLAEIKPQRLASVGLSKQKTSYLLDLARKVQGGQVRLRSVGRMNDEEVVHELTQVKGVGRWTAQMFLIFSLGRLDVLPYDDLGIRKAISQIYQLSELPDREVCEEIASPWRPYASVASWYCWRSLDQPVEKMDAESGYPS